MIPAVPRKERVLVVGASGMLGRSLMRELNRFPSEFEVLGTAHSRVLPGLWPLNAMIEAEVAELFATFQPTKVINCAAERVPERAAENPSKARELNVMSAARLAKECAHIKATLVHISTDYVFDGGVHTRHFPPYDVDAPTRPLNFYGETKLDSERAVLDALGDRALIVRVPVLYALDCDSLSESASLVVARTLLVTQPIFVDDWGVRFPTCVDDVSVVLRKLLARGSTGVLHISSPFASTKYGQALMMAEALQRDVSLLKADPSPPMGEPRPANTQMDCRRTWAALGEEHSFIPLGEGLARALERFRADFPANRR